MAAVPSFRLSFGNSKLTGRGVLSICVKAVTPLCHPERRYCASADDDRDDATPHPAFGHPLPAARGEGQRGEGGPTRTRAIRPQVPPRPASAGRGWPEAG